MKIYLRLVAFLRSHLWVFFLACISMVISAVLDGVSLGMIVPAVDRIFSDGRIVIDRPLPQSLTGLLDKVNSTPQLTLLNIMVGTLIGLFFLKGIFTFIRGYLMNDVTQRLTRDIRDSLYRKISSLSLDYFDRTKTGELVSRITYDVGVIQNSISEGLTNLIYQSLQIALFILIIFYISPRLALVSLVMLPLIILPMLSIGRVLRHISVSVQEGMANINSTLYETISGIRIVKAFCMEGYEGERFGSHNRDFYRMVMKSMKRMNALAPLTEFIGALGAAFVLWYGGQEVLKGGFSAGVFVYFLGALLMLIRPFRRLSIIHGINQQAIAAGNRIFDILDKKPTIEEKKGAIQMPPLKEELSFEKIYFSYDEKGILKDINLTVKKGEKLALVGPSGVGKTTLVNLIPRFYDPVKGLVKIDGIDIRKFNLHSLRMQIGLVSQEILLFNDTVKANIAYGDPKGGIKEVGQAARIANAHDFIAGLSRGYDTLIGDRGVKLSGGERQRLAIARAVYKDPPILILDEATSQLDAHSEKLVQDAMDRLMEKRTVFIIAHRLSTARKADRIVVLDKGEIKEIGSHKELLGKGGLYKRLYNMQFQEKTELTF